ncbi:MAG: TniQ family protein [Candidatus Thiodiazotropha endolucinida]
MPYLFPLSLRGEGTVDIEAVSSYIHRLAEAHAVTVGRLLRHVHSWYCADYPELKSNLTDYGARGALPIYVRPNSTNEHIVKMLIHVTGQQGLRSGTFVALNLALDRSVGTFSRKMRWCPACMAEFEQQGEGGYFKLLWHIQAITHCPTHGLQLQDLCGLCGAAQVGYGYKRECTVCQACGGPLSAGVDQCERGSSWSINGSDLIELVENIACRPAVTFPEGGVRRVVSELFDRAWEQGQEQRFWSLIPRDECLSITTGQRPITLMLARRLAYRLGMTLPNLLHGEVELSSPAIDPIWCERLPAEMVPKKRRSQHNRKSLFKKVSGILKDAKGTSPPPLCEVAKTVGVSTGCLQYHFPVLANDIVKRHREWKRTAKEQKRVAAQAAALVYYSDKTKAIKSRKHALRILREATGLPKNVLRKAIAHVDEGRNYGVHTLKN